MDPALNTILYVEDDSDIQKLVKFSLEVLGNYEVVICSSGQEALDGIGDINPQMVLLDVMMPGMDGIEVYKHLRQQSAYKHLPVVFITAKVQKHEVEEYRLLGAAGVIVKPFSPDELAHMVEEFWCRHCRQSG